MHIFISHSNKDDVLVALLAKELRREGFTVWNDSEINSGTTWSDAIEKAIRDSSAVLLVLTPDSCSSAYVTFEWAFAWGSGKTLIPLLIRDCETLLHPRLKLIQCRDFRQPKPSDWSGLFEDLRRSPPSGSGMVRLRPPEVDTLVDRLRSADTDERVSSVRSLALYTHPSAEEALSEGLTSPFFDVRFEAALALAPKGDERALRPLLEGMRAAAAEVREKARVGFFKLAAAIAGPSIFDALPLIGDALPSIGDALNYMRSGLPTLLRTRWPRGPSPHPALGPGDVAGVREADDLAAGDGLH